jgi:hypothetical protein
VVVLQAVHLILGRLAVLVDIHILQAVLLEVRQVEQLPHKVEMETKLSNKRRKLNESNKLLKLQLKGIRDTQ